MNRDAETVLNEYLVLTAQGGSADAFRRLAERWTPRLSRHARRMLLDADAAADAVQEAWLAVAKGLKRLDDPSRFPSWAFAITTRKCADEIRRRQRGRRFARDSVDQTALSEPAHDDPDQALDLNAAVSRLPPDQRLLISLFYAEGLSVDDLALALHVPPGTIKSRLHAIRQILKTHMEGSDHVASR